MSLSLRMREKERDEEEEEEKEKGEAVTNGEKVIAWSFSPSACVKKMARRKRK